MSRSVTEILDNYAFGMTFIEFLEENMRRYKAGIPVLPIPRQRYAYYDDEITDKYEKYYRCIND